VVRRKRLLDERKLISFETQRLSFEPKPLSFASQQLSLEPKPLSFESQRLSFELKPLSLESQRLSLEPKPLSFESQRLSFGPKPLSLESQQLSLEPKPLSHAAGHKPATATLRLRWYVACLVGFPGPMGLEIDRDTFAPADYERYAARLSDCLEALRGLLERPAFGNGEPTVGAELELNLIDANGRPVCRNSEVLAAAANPRLSVEIDRFNVELNSTPVALEGRPFTALARELHELLAATRDAASRNGATLVLIGILPTLEPEDLGHQTLSDRARYRAMCEGLRTQRGSAFHVHIEGDDALDFDADDVSLEGANASFQLHLRVQPQAFARTYNAAQIATAPALAIACNSPMLFGRLLWDETRIALFRQSVDERADVAGEDWRPARVSFGHGWVRRGVYELFAETVALHAPLLPAMGKENPLAVLRAGGVPELAELRLHQGTVWRWNRPVYDHAAGGHLRIELRALPSGPTVVDMVSNGAFVLGLTLGLAPVGDELVQRMTFGHARRNFYEAARRGLDAALLWPTDAAPSPRPVPLRELLRELLPIARRGLVDSGVAGDEADGWLAVVEGRIAAWTSGARWQRRAVRADHRCDLSARAEMLLRYADLSRSGAPVHTWPEAAP
jgi:hypothetical protein